MRRKQEKSAPRIFFGFSQGSPVVLVNRIEGKATMQATSKKATRERRLVKIDAAIFAGMAIDHGRDNGDQIVTIAFRDRRGSDYGFALDEDEFAKLKLLVLNTLTRAERDRAREIECLDTPKSVAAGA